MGEASGDLDGIVARINGAPGMVSAWEMAFNNNLPTAWKTNPDFLGKLRVVWDYTFVNGTNVKLPNITLEATQLTKVSDEVAQQMRNIFNSTGRKDFLTDLGNNSQISTMLREAGYTDVQIPELVQRLRDGFVLPGHQVHHKIPIEYGGTNDFSNLVLMKQTPYHSAMTSFQNSQINIPIGQTQTLDFPKVTGKFYSPPYIE